MKSTFLLVWLVLMTVGTDFDSNVWAEGVGGNRVLISIRAERKLLKDVLKEIEQKTGYTIKVDRPLGERKVSFRFNNVPLSESIQRLFSGTNYSILFDDKKKEISVLSLGKVQRDTKVLFDSDDKMERKLQGHDQGVMAVIDSVLELHKKAVLRPSALSRQPEESPMTISTKALEKHQETLARGGQERSTTGSGNSPMAISEHVLEIHRQGLAKGTLQSSVGSGSFSMSEADAAMKAHREVLKKKK